MSVPPERKYSSTHEWYQIDGNIVTVGITQHAADELTDITYVELPEVGRMVQAGSVVGEIESVKATSELICGVSGKVVAVNESLGEKPELINNDAFGQGWMLKIEISDSTALGELLDAASYEASIA